jgi:peptidoglycan/xylan/chitin deacetylase (PgdA/CDA1 family)
MRGAAYVMYHELEREGRPLIHSEPGYARYVLHENDFGRHLELLAQSGFRGASVGELLKPPDNCPAVAITFDDGSETDALIAAPLLARLGFSATFYVVSGFVNRAGYLSESQLCELANANFEIGCHSRSHAYLTDLDDPHLKSEIAAAKSDLEQILGRQVEHFSCPGGRWNPHVAQVARDAGYRSVTTSRTGINYRDSDPYRLARVAILRGTSPDEFLRICRGENLGARRGRELLLNGAKALLGNSTYEWLRGVLLRTT